MRARNQTVLREVFDPRDAAIETVVSRYRKIAPAITRFARSLSGNDRLRVTLGSEAAASKDEVVCDPRLFQAAYARNAPVTADEVAIASALHEVVHLVATDLEEKRAVPAGWPIAGTPSDDPVDLLTAIAECGGPVTEALFFTLEDARQERQNLVTYPGARSVLTDLYRAAYPSAARDAGPLAQFALSCFLVCGGYSEREPLERRINARAAVALAEASDVLTEAAEAIDPWEVASLALRLTEIARNNGLLTKLTETATQAQQRAGEENDADSIAEGVDQVRLSSPVVRDARSYSDTKRAAQARAGVTDREGNSELGADPATDQLLRVSEAPSIYLPTGQSGKLITAPVPARFASLAADGRASLGELARSWSLAQREVSGELFPLFAANQRRGLRSGYDQGDVSPHSALFIGAGLYTRMYERRAARTRRTYAVSLLVDASASMLQPRSGIGGNRSSWGMSAALLGAWTLARLCDELQIDFEVALFNRSFAARQTDTEWAYTRSRGQATAGLRQTQGSAADRLAGTVNHYLVKPFDRRWREAEDLLAGLFWVASEPTKAAMLARRSPKEAPPISMFDKASNVDEFNLAYAAERMGRLGASVRVMVVLADGMTRGSIKALASTVEAVERSGTTVLGIGIGDDTVTTAYHRHQIVERPDALARAMVEGVRSSLRHSLTRSGMETWWARPVRQSRKEPLSA